MATPRQLSNAPLREAVVDIRVSHDDTFEPESLRAAIPELSPAFANRIALRYINAIDVLLPVGLEDVFTAPPRDQERNVLRVDHRGDGKEVRMTTARWKSQFSFRPMRTSSSAYVSPIHSMAASPASTVIDDLQERVADAHLASEYLAANVLDTLSDLHAAFDEASYLDWDGHGAEPAEPAAYQYAQRFATLLGSAHQPTEVSVDPDGEVSLDWDHGPDAVVSVSVSGQGRLAYAARLGPSRSRGVERLSNEVPEQILTLVRRVGMTGA